MAVRGWVDRGVGVVFVLLLVSCTGGSPASKEVDEVSSGSTPETEVSSWLLSGSESYEVPAMPAGEPRQVWTRDAGEPIDAHVVIGDRFFYATRTGWDTFDVVGISLADGDELWRRSLEGTIEAGTRHEPPMEGGGPVDEALLDHDLYLVARSAERFTRLDVETGEEVWALDTDDLSYPTLTGQGPNACLGYTETDPAGDSRYHCIGLRDGEEMWTERGYVVAVGDEVTYLRSDVGLVAIDGADGTVLWNVLGATGTVLEIGGDAVVCDQRSVYGMDREGVRQWDLVAASPSCLRGSSTTVLVRELDQLREVRAEDGVEVGEPITLEEGQYPTGIVDDRYLLTTAYDEGTRAVDLKTGEVDERPPAQRTLPVRAGAIQVANPGVDDSGEAGTWGISGWELEGGGWDAAVGWTHPGAVPTDQGLLIVDLGYAGNLWFGAPDGSGPSLTEVGAEFADQQVPPDDLLLDGTSVLGIPFGTPVEEAIEQLTELLGPPSLRNDHGDPEGYPPLRQMWGTLQVEIAEVDGVRQVAGWSDWSVGLSSGWRIAGDLRTWSMREDLEAAGYREIVDGQLCRDGVCFAFWYDLTEPQPANEVQAPGPPR